MTPEIASKLNRALTRAARSSPFKGDQAALLRHLHQDLGMSLGALAKRFGVTRPAVAYALKRRGIQVGPRGRPSQLQQLVRQKGFVDLSAYFRARSHVAFEVMGQELEVTPETIRRHYAGYLNEFVRKQSRG